MKQFTKKELSDIHKLVNKYNFDDFCQIMNIDLSQSIEQPVIPYESDNPWPTKDVLTKLIWATEHLLHEKNYDGHGYEELELCVKRGKEILLKLNTVKEQPKLTDLREELIKLLKNEQVEITYGVMEIEEIVDEYLKHQKQPKQPLNNKYPSELEYREKGRAT